MSEATVGADTWRTNPPRGRHQHNRHDRQSKRQRDSETAAAMPDPVSTRARAGCVRGSPGHAPPGSDPARSARAPSRNAPQPAGQRISSSSSIIIIIYITIVIINLIIISSITIIIITSYYYVLVLVSALALA